MTPFSPPSFFPACGLVLRVDGASAAPSTPGPDDVRIVCRMSMESSVPWSGWVVTRLGRFVPDWRNPEVLGRVRRSVDGDRWT